MIRKSWLRYLFIGFLTFAIVWNSPIVLLAGIVKNEPKHKQAQLLLKTGRAQLNRDQPAEALKTLQDATKLYRQLNNQEGITKSLVYQNYALQQLGLHFQACKKLIGALKLNDSLCEPSILPTPKTELEKLKQIIQQIPLTPANFLALQSLGEVLRLNYKLSESEEILNQILISNSIFPELSSNIVLLLGNTQRDIYKRIKQQYQWIDEPLIQDIIINVIPQKAESALLNYQAIINKSDTSISTKLQAQLNCLDLLIDFQEWLKDQPRFPDIQTRISQQIEPLISEILQETLIFESLSPEQSVQARLKLVNSLSKLPKQQMRLQAINYAQDAWQIAKNINSSKLKAKSLQMLGDLEPEKSLDYFETALILAQSVRAKDIMYSLQAKLGNLYQKQGKIEAALQAYGAAVNSVTSIRANLLSSNADSQFFFYEEVDPIYRNYMALIAKSTAPNYDLIAQIHEQIQTAELEDYLKCGKLELVALNKIKNSNVAAAIIHIIDLSDTILVIVKSPGKPSYHHSVDASKVRNPVNTLLELLQDPKLVLTNESLLKFHSQAIYQQLIAPLESHLPNAGTLAFVLDKSFQSLPMHLLHNRQDYWLANHSFTGTLGSKIPIPKALLKQQMQALIAGLYVPSPSLNDSQAPQGAAVLPQIKEEVEDVKKLTHSSLVLLNEEFTSKNFKQKISKTNFPIVHISTHGQFSSDIQRTGFLAYDRQINIVEFDSLLRNKARISPGRIELLVLSACQTAKGNRRSALGIAGVAVQAGARSTVASLWLVEAKSTVLLMQKFYLGLNNGLTKAEALRQAQLSLKSNPKYNHPYYWAPFILVGSPL
ncbi:tetratricopeptide domain-containing protein (plasmid) [Anabaenopsis circularis NIES-21]|uniref:Tetratricopeptide domain-containing protein n=1 Tax=Anabaenopsis circularis NIES-21 TaxID=1085406 RepID=A0A1Z4GRC0_9CYAN|nr:tetratricopeptide domain-containing protein [Anabaenopsis circularis NIES-21]